MEMRDKIAKIISFIVTFVLLGSIVMADELKGSAAYLYIDISTITTESYKDFKINNKDHIMKGGIE